MLRGAASRVGPLPPRLRDGAHLTRDKWAGAKLKRGGGLVNDTTPVPHIFQGQVQDSTTSLMKLSLNKTLVVCACVAMELKF